MDDGSGTASAGRARHGGILAVGRGGDHRHRVRGASDVRQVARASGTGEPHVWPPRPVCQPGQSPESHTGSRWSLTLCSGRARIPGDGSGPRKGPRISETHVSADWRIRRGAHNTPMSRPVRALPVGRSCSMGPASLARGFTCQVGGRSCLRRSPGLHAVGSGTQPAAFWDVRDGTVSATGSAHVGTGTRCRALHGPRANCAAGRGLSRVRAGPATGGVRGLWAVPD